MTPDQTASGSPLDRPNIVPIYEIGTHDGRQYFSMKFLEGGSLARLPRGDAKTEAARVALIARAVHFAHQRSVLHRDLKPSNVLVDVAGVLYVADFGLAKRTDAGQSLSESGAFLGTPRYVAPEQATGSKALTWAADTYSLGVVLYERLTSKVPFTGETALEVLRRLHTEEPARPSQWVPGLDRDLETVCLRCLRKEPAERYATAEGLADDLERYLRGEPIAARPVGNVERLWRWCRRNPAVAGLTGGLAAALVLGMVISTGFAVFAWQQAHKARSAQQKSEENLVRSWLRPLGYKTAISWEMGEGLDTAEKVALTEVATTDDDRLRLLFLEKALDDSITASRFARRTEMALQAAVGLSEHRRARARELALGVQADTKVHSDIRITAGWIAMMLHSADDRIWVYTIDGLVSSKKTAGSVLLSNGSPNTSFLHPYRGPKVSRFQRQAVLTTWRRALATSDRDVFMMAWDQIKYCVSLLPPLDEGELQRTADDLLMAMAALPDQQEPPTSLADALNEVSFQMSVGQRVRIKTSLLDILRVTTNDSVAYACVQSLTAVGIVLDQADVRHLCELLCTVIHKNTSTIPIRTLVSLGDLAERENLPDYQPVADTLVRRLGITRAYNPCPEIWTSLGTIANKLTDKQRRRLVETLLGHMGDARAPDETVRDSCRTLGALVERSAADDNAALLAFSQALVSVMRSKSWEAPEAAGDALVIVARRLNDDQLRRLADDLIDLYPAKADPSVVSRVLGGIAPRMPTAQLQSLVDILIAENGVLKIKYQEESETAELLGIIAARLDDDRLRRVAGALLKSLNTKDGYDGKSSRTLSLVAARLPTAELPRIADALLKLLRQTMVPSQMSGEVGPCPLVMVAARLAAVEKQRLVEEIFEILATTEDSLLVAAASTGLVEMVKGLDLGICRRAAQAIAAASERANDFYHWSLAIKAQRSIAVGYSDHEAAGISHELTLTLLDDYYRGRWEGFPNANRWGPVDGASEVFPSLVATHDRITQLVELLRHPACWGPRRETVLFRLEQLAFPLTVPDTQTAIAPATVAALIEPSSAAMLAAGRSLAWERQRRCRTVWDAVAWLKAHHPAIDLDAPYVPTAKR